MVLLILSPAAKLAVDEYCSTKRGSGSETNTTQPASLEDFAALRIGDPVDHHRLVEISRYLLSRDNGLEATGKWCVDTLLNGSAVYQPPRPSRPEPTPQFQALMQRLRQQEEQRQYERMTNPSPQVETFKQRFPNSPYDFDPATSHGQSADYDVVDEVTYADVNRQMILIINVLVSIVACSIAIWIAARHWSGPQRLALSLTGSGVVAFAEVAIYLGYIKRIEDAKTTEGKVIERKQVVETWVIDKSALREGGGSVRQRKVKSR